MRVSTVLTSTLHRRCAPRKNRRIPTIPAGCFGGRLVHVSTVDTGPRGSESGVLGGAARRLRLRPAPARRLRGARSKVGPSRSRIWPCPLPVRGPGGHGSTPAPPRVGPSRPTPRGSGSTDRGLCVLHEDPTYPKYPQPSSSSTPPSCSASRRHRQPPQSPGQPLRQAQAAALSSSRPTPPVS